MPTSAKRRKPRERVPDLPRGAIKRGKAVAARYRIVLWREDGEWYGQGVEEPGAMGDGKTIVECVRAARYAMALAAATRIAHGEPVVRPLIDRGRGQRRAG